MCRRPAHVLVLALLFWPRAGHASDVYTFFDGECRRTSGILVEVDETTVAMVDLEGHFVRRERSLIHSAVLHQPLENPLAVIHIDEALGEFLREVWVEEDKPSFIGWATSFYDDLYIFLDVEGKTHVIEPGDVYKVADASVRAGAHSPRVHAVPKLGFPPEIVPCSKAAPQPDELPPSRVIADRIKLGDYFGKLEESYRALSDFEERTKVYATPFVFDETSRVGLIYLQDMDLPVPFYFRWSSGRPYRFQTETVVGNAVHRALPFVDPTLSVSSDLKSHFFHATFIGHFLALPAGANPYILEGLDGDELPTTNEVDASYNYLIMMGADYWRLSASAGPSYLTTRVTVPGEEPRNVLAQHASISARLRYQTPRLSARLLYFRTSQSGSLDDILDDATMISPGAAYTVRTHTVRMGATITLIEGVSLDADEIVTIGSYRERMWPIPIDLSYQHFETSAILSADFGRYVTVKGYARFLYRRYDIEQPTSNSDSRLDRTFGGGLEFVF
jgi:hypothetical protein